MSTKISQTDFNALIEVLRNFKLEIFYNQEEQDKKSHEIIDNFKDNPEVLFKILHDTLKPYKSMKDIKKLLKDKNIDVKVKANIIKFILDYIEL